MSVGYDRAHRSLEYTMMASHLALTLVVAKRWVATSTGWVDVALAVIMAPLSCLMADVASGVVHFLADRYGSLETPFLGPNVLRSFREHHDEPLAIVEHDFVTLTGDVCLATVPFLGIALLVLHGDTPLERVGLAVAAFTAALGATTSLFHKWAHAPNVPRVVGFLQRHGLLLSQARHAEHHRAPYDKAFSITNGWADRWLHLSHWLMRMERRLGRADSPAP
ncbi:MAG: hypothetical protein IPG50_10210 [Myxococcales bacterium]|nr:hypothetical protein [Myxococcales bacterium]